MNRHISEVPTALIFSVEGCFDNIELHPVIFSLFDTCPPKRSLTKNEPFPVEFSKYRVVCGHTYDLVADERILESTWRI
jgi:hypothetical protein